MQLTKQTDFGLRVLLYLAVRPQQRASASEIARVFNLSHHHLLKVINRLATAGIIDTYRGKKGGVALALPPDAIRVGAVVRTLEGESDLINCTQPSCPARPACNLKGLVDNALQAFFGVLDACTLDDLIRDSRDALGQLLAPETITVAGK